MRSVVLGAALWGALVGPLQAQEVLRTYVGGGSAGRGLGQVLRQVGDLDGDGVLDLAASYRVGSTLNGNASGTVRVFSGRDGSVLHTFMGAAAGDQLGFALDCAGDLDGDGRDDLLIGIPGDDAGGTDAGAVVVLSGRDGTPLLEIRGPFSRARSGWGVAGLGDVDGDGQPDFAFSGQPDPGTPQPAGFVRIVSGADGSLIREHLGASSASRLGCSLSAAGDVDGDGITDVVSGDRRDSTTALAAGAVHVWSGATGALLHSFYGDRPQDQLGLHVAAAGDLDADGRADLLAGTPFADGASWDLGLARAWSGRDGTVLLNLQGEFPQDFFGAAVSGAGDVDGDGREDVLVGAFADDDGGTNAGRARVYSGADGSIVFEIDGNSAGDELGFAACAAGDVDGDGGSDFAVAAPLDDAGGGPQSGAVRVYAGIPPPLVGPQSYCETSPNSVGPGARMGWSGSTSVATNDLALRATEAVPHSVGVFLVSTQRAALPLWSGTLCVAPPLRRLPPWNRIGRDGTVERRVDLQGRGWALAGVEPGATRCFQLLYVDRRGRSCALKLSDGLEVTFTP